MTYTPVKCCFIWMTNDNVCTLRRIESYEIQEVYIENLCDVLFYIYEKVFRLHVA